MTTVLSSPKGFTSGTHRTCSPEETWERIKPFFAQFGLTRVADVTGLDRLGIPVTLAYRPNSPTMTSSTGKGLTLAAANVSGAMEAMELFHAEHYEIAAEVASYDEMARRGAVLAREDLPLTRFAVFSPGWPERWVSAGDLVTGEQVAVPLTLVPLSDERLEGDNNIRSFQMGSNGLASGNTYAEALVSALLEVIERDAVTSAAVVQEVTGIAPERVMHESVVWPDARSLLERLDEAGILCDVRLCTSDLDVPIFECRLYDLREPTIGTGLGYGAHLDPEIAMLRAITEAAQGRLVMIAGSRDDIFRRGLRLIHASDPRTVASEILRTPGTVDAGTMVSQAAGTFEDDVAILVEKLRRSGLRRVLTFDLSRPNVPFSVVRVIVPGLEGYKFDYYTPGPRALAMLRRRQSEVA